MYNYAELPLYPLEMIEIFVALIIAIANLSVKTEILQHVKTSCYMEMHLYHRQHCTQLTTSLSVM